MLQHPARSPRTPARILVVAVVLQLVLFATVGASVAHLVAPQPDGYLATFATQVDFVQWTADAKHALTGTWHTSYIDSLGALQSEDVPITGTLDGSDITFMREGDGYSFSGTFQGYWLILTATDAAGDDTNYRFQRASIQGYNHAVDALRQRSAAGL